MSDNENQAEELPFFVDRAKGGRAACKGCKEKCLDSNLRIAKLVASPYSDGKKMKSWYHLDCLMTVFLKQRPTTKRIEGPEDIGNWENISQEDKDLILEKLEELEKLCIQKYGDKVVKQNKSQPKPKAQVKVDTAAGPSHGKGSVDKDIKVKSSKDDLFKEFRRLCVDLMNNDAYTAKTAVIKKLFSEGTDGSGFKSDITLWCRLLLPGAVKRVYNLKSKQLVKLFARMFHTDQDDMLTDLENGDVAETIRIFFEQSSYCTPATKSLLTMREVDEFLEKLSQLTKEDEQVFHFKSILKQCTSNDLKMIIRLVKGDLRINAGPKPILDAIHPDAYKMFQTSRDLDALIARVLKPDNTSKESPVKGTMKANVLLMTPVLPMLATACKSVEMAMKKCPNGMFSEIKYDGERVQLHKEGSEFKYFSRALKPVMPHKINLFKDYIPKAFPHGKDLILDAEVLMIDTETGKPLPFGSLGLHKKSEFKDAEVCLFVFDCIYYNGEILIDKPMRERRKILEHNMTEIKNHVMFSEMELIRKPSDLANMIAKVLKLGLEGLVLKDLESKYEPGKRHWLKVKKDYLFDGAMADSADLVVLGAWFGSGKKGGMLSVFLMGCYDKFKDKWLTVTKVHTGHDDKTLEALQDPLREGMEKIAQDSSRVPSWLKCTKTMVPDFVAKDPKKQPVWEITGTELTQAQIHTADGISVRFPRVTRIRDDKTWDTATTLKELKVLYKTSKEHTDVSLLNKLAAEAAKDEVDDETNIKKELKDTKASPKKIDQFFNRDSKTSKTKVKMELDTDEIDTHTLTKRKDELDFKTSPLSIKKKEIKIENESDDDMDGSYNAPNISLKRKSSNEYAHLPGSNSKLPKSPEKPLPNIFNNFVLSFHNDDRDDSLKFKIKDFKRHWIAYGGKIDEGYGCDVTHIVHFNNEMDMKDLQNSTVNYPKTARHVTENWLKESLEHKKLLDTRLFSVNLRNWA